MPTYTATDNTGRTITTQSLWQAAAPLTVTWTDQDGAAVPKDVSRVPARWLGTPAPWADNQAVLDQADRAPFAGYLAQHPAERPAYEAESAKYPVRAPWA